MFTCVSERHFLCLINRKRLFRFPTGEEKNLFVPENVSAADFLTKNAAFSAQTNSAIKRISLIRRLV